MEFNVDFSRLKTIVTRDKIKLWLPPYYDEKDGSRDDELQKLAAVCGKELSLPAEVCKNYIVELQNTALNNLKEKNKYQATGIASLKVRVPNEQGGSQIITIDIELCRSGYDLRDAISKKIFVPIERLKLIAKGLVLKDSGSLDLQGVKHGLQIMAIVLSDLSDGASTSESHAKLLDSTIADVHLLNDHDDEVDEQFLQVADQTGKPLNLPKEELRALTLAMTLHEKGRAALKAENFALAIVMLLEAEKEFTCCNSSLLKSVDNYGVLSLDIAWCYLNLQSVTQLPDAEERLKRCEVSFQQSYGVNFERLIAVKGSEGNERALLMRLHLLQAIVLYHQDKIDRAKGLLQKAETELSELKVDDLQMSQLMELGYTAAESRIGLRAAKGDLPTAVTIMDNKRSERQKNDEAEDARRQLQREKKKLGQCLDGSWVEPQFHKALMSMGYSHETARWGLAQTNNNIGHAISLIQEHPELLPTPKVSQDALDQVTAIGFDPRMAKIALQKHRGHVESAVEELVLRGGYISGEDVEDNLSEDRGAPSTSKRSKKQVEAYSRVADGLTDNEEDHLDLTLVAEEGFLLKYKDLISRR